MLDIDTETRRLREQDQAHGCNPPPARPDVIRRWADVRASLGLSIRDMADTTGINRGTLSKIEAGLQCPTPEQAALLLGALTRDEPRELAR